MKQSELTAEIEAQAEQSYNQLEGEWAQWLEVAKRYEHKVKSQDRSDIRHTILLELHKARQRDDKPLPLLRAYRIASLTVALYWREIIKPLVKVCVYHWEAKTPHCASCEHKPSNGKRCQWLGYRPMTSLNIETQDGDGEGVRLLDTVASLIVK